MNLFFSYGHDDNQEVVHQLSSDLIKRGHKVWVDTTGIHESQNWRSTITREIENSDAVVSFFSNHAFRDYGVCLDELMIAVGLRGSLIQGVKLETLKNERVLRESISYQKVIDMRGWKEMKQSGQYDAWYKKKLSQILQFIEDPYVESFSREIEQIRGWLHPHNSMITQRLLEGTCYAPRVWLRSEVENAMKDHSRITLITGDPGSGKSMFMAHEFISFEPARVLLFCKYNDRSNVDLLSLISELIFMLAAREDSYRAQLLKLIPAKLESTNNTYFENCTGEELFEDLVIRPLSLMADQAKENSETEDMSDLYILIDGLDEMNPRESASAIQNPMTTLIKEKAGKLPDFVKLLLTSRKDDSILNDLMPLAQIVSIDDKNRISQNTEEVSHYLENRCLRDSGQDHLLSNLTHQDRHLIAEKSRGNFLYAAKIMDALETGLFTREDIFDLPPDLSEFYFHLFYRLFPGRSDYEKCRQILAALTYSNSVIPENTLLRLVQDDFSDPQLRIQKLSILLSRSQAGVTFFHKSLPDWLTSADSYDFFLDEHEGHEAVYAACLNAYHQGVSEMNEYELRYLLPMAKELQSAELDKILHDEMLAVRQVKAAQQLEQEKRIPSACDLMISAAAIFETLGKTEDAFLAGRKAADYLHKLARPDQTIETATKAIEQGNKLLNQLQTHDSKEERDALDTALGDLYMALAYARYRRNENNEVEDCYLKAEEHFGRANNLERTVFVLTRRFQKYNLGTEFKKIRPLFNQVKERNDLHHLKETDLKSYCRFLRLLAIGARNLGLPNNVGYEMALKYLDEEIDIIHNNSGVLGLDEIGQCYYERGVALYKFEERMEEALDNCQKALAYISEDEGAESVGVCDSLGQIGHSARRLWQIRNDQKYYDLAQWAFQRAYDIRKRVYTDMNRFATISLGNLLMLYMDLETKDSIQQAEDLMPTVLEVREKLFENDFFWRADGYMLNARLLLLKDRNEEACQYYLHAADCYHKANRTGKEGICLKDAGKAIDDPLKKMELFQQAAPLIESEYPSNHGAVREIHRLIESCS